MQVNARPGTARKLAVFGMHRGGAMTSLPFGNRLDAAQQLARALARYRGTRPLVLAIPRGAVPMGRVIADALEGDLDVALVKKIGAPGNPEVAVGSVDEQGNIEINDVGRWLGVDAAYVRAQGAAQLAALRARRELYRGVGPIPVAGRVVIVVDDGLATGATMSAALKSVRRQGAARLVCAVPVGASEAVADAEALADEVVCLAVPAPFGAVGRYFLDFSEVPEERVLEALSPARRDPVPERSEPSRARAMAIPAGAVSLAADLGLPEGATGLVVFVHGSGSSRRSPRNQEVAASLNRRGMATLLFDLLTERENEQVALRFDIPLLTRRLRDVLDWVRSQPIVAQLPVGLFGASTGAAAALRVVADDAGVARAVVSRGGRPDLAGIDALSRVRTPTLLIVGGDDREVLQLNRAAREAIGESAHLAIVPGAGHLFEEAGTLAQAAQLAGDFFAREFKPAGSAIAGRRFGG
jgi:predicted phosphoribosyltransferase/dienelactone hydrolase